MYFCLDRYTYTLSGALDIGVALCVVLSGLGMGLSETSMPNWWGVTVVDGTLDAKRKAVTKLFIKGKTAPIGPTTW